MANKIQSQSITNCVLQAIKQGSVKALRNLLRLGVKVNIPGKGNWIPIHEAAYLKQIPCLKILLKHDSSLVNYQAFAGETPLIVACGQGSVDGVKILLENGADPNIQSRGGESPLIAAIDSKNGPSLIPILIEFGADVNVDDYSEWNAVHSAIELNDVESFQLLLKAGLNVKKFVINNDESTEINRYWTRLIKKADHVTLVELFIVLWTCLNFNDWLALADHASRNLPVKHFFHTFHWRPYTSVPHCLIHLCRLKIRENLMASNKPPSIYKVNVDQLNLPKQVNDILLYEENLL